MFAKFWQAAPFCMLAAVIIVCFAVVGPKIRTPEDMIERFLTWLDGVLTRTGKED